MARPRSDLDLEALRRDYTAGKFTNVELSEKHGKVVTPQRIGQLAIEHGWSKDLTAAVRTATRAKVIRKTAEKGVDTRKQVAATIAVAALDQARGQRPEKVRAIVQQMVATVEAAEAQTDAETVMEVAEANAGVILRHQRLTDDMVVLMDTLRGELMEATTESGSIAELVDALREQGPEGKQTASKLRSLMTMGSRIANLDKLASAAVRIVTLQRQAHNLDDEKPVEDNSYEAALRRLSEGVPS